MDSINDGGLAVATAIALLTAAKKKRVSLYETPCKECCFATFDTNTESRVDTQVGCRFNRIEKFKKQGVNVKEAYDSDKEFYVIEAACLLHKQRQSPWARQTPGRERMKAARREITLNIDVVILMGPDSTVEQLDASIKSVQDQSHQPQNVRVPVNRDGLTPNEVRAVMPGDWICQFIMERDAEGKRIPMSRCVDHAVHGSKSDFYVVFNAGYRLPPSFLDSIDCAINDDLERFILLEPDEDWPCEVVQMRAHHYYGGNAEAVVESEDAGPELGMHADTIAEKIKHRARVEGFGHLVRKVGEIACRSVSTK